MSRCIRSPDNALKRCASHLLPFPPARAQEARQREREERQRAAAERAAKLAADVKRRAAESKLLFKKTGHGQPVMKHRVDKILAQLQRQ